MASAEQVFQKKDRSKQVGERSQRISSRISVIIPLGSRYESLETICVSLRRVLLPIAKDYEVIIVDDATGPNTRKKVENLTEKFPEVRAIRLRRWMGESAVLAIGAESAKGEILVILDPYLHVGVEDLPRLLEPLGNGCDLVCAWRWPRTDSGLSRLASNSFNAAARWLTGVSVHDLNCRTRAMRRQVIEELPLYGDLHRFLPIFAARRGYNWCEVKIAQRPGKKEIGAFDLRSYVRRFLDLVTLAFLTRFVKRPLHFFGLVGFGTFLIGAMIGTYLAYTRFVLSQGIGHRPLLLLAVFLAVVGIQMGSIGLLGELMIYTHARDLKDYAIKEQIGEGGNDD